MPHLPHAFCCASGRNDVVGHCLRWQPARGAARVCGCHCTQHSRGSAYYLCLGDNAALPFHCAKETLSLAMPVSRHGSGREMGQGGPAAEAEAADAS